VAQCAEHIALSERLIWQWTSSLMAAPATPEKIGSKDYKRTADGSRC
jgi:hypothetical protein